MEGFFSMPAHPCAPCAAFLDPEVETGNMTRTWAAQGSPIWTGACSPPATSLTRELISDSAEMSSSWMESGAPPMLAPVETNIRTAAKVGTFDLQGTEIRAPPGLPAMNIGSGGHPELCANICVDFQNGACAKGSTCLLCHAVHTGKQVKLDKKQRQALRSLGQRELLEMLARRVTDRCVQAGLTTQAFPLVQLILDRLYSLPLTEPTLSGSGLRNLEKTLGKMSCKRMIIHASTNPFMDASFAETMENQILSLRRQIAAGSPAHRASYVWL
mmetsp:Transcript_64203/g.142785  ORF Transcript_64203/g.142785 Transcript_64203/m.142785 type:complete len:272 (+) Transcript_64203:59-874(+)